MRKLFTFLVTMVIAMVANAADIRPTAVIGEGATSVAALEGKTFAIINKAEGKALYGSNNQNLAYDVYANAFVSTNSGYKWKLVSLADDADESVRSYYRLRLVTPSGEGYNIWGSEGFLNSQSADGACSFILGLNNQNGQDLPNGAVYDVQYVEGQGFSLKNIGTGFYQGANTLPAKAEEPAYFDFVEEVGFNYIPAVKDLLAEGEAMKANVSDEAAKEAYDAAIANIDPDAITGDGLAEAQAIDAALNALAKYQHAAGSDMTRAIVNAEINGAEGWTIERPQGGNGPTLNNASFEYWAGSANPRNEASFDYYQVITGLPNGFYTVGADMYNSLNNEGGDYTVFSPTCGVYAKAGETEVSQLVDVEGAELKPYTTDLIKVTDGTLRIGVKNLTTPMAARWFVADNFKLTLVDLLPTYTVAIAEGIENGTVEATPAEAAEGETVTLAITPAEGYELEAVTVKDAEENDVEVSEEYTFIMPAAAVTVAATFAKVAEPEPDYADVKLTYVDGNDDTADTAYGEVTEALIGYNKIANGTVALANKSWGVNKIGYVKVDASKFNGTITSAKMTAEVSGCEGKRTAGWGVGYNSSEWSADLTYNTADKSITPVGTEYWTTTKAANVFEPVEFDITEAFAEGNVANILVYELAAGGGTIRNIKVAVEYIPGAPQIANASFEADGEKAANNGPLTITGWTETIDGVYNNTELRPANSESNTSQFGTSDPSDGDFSLFARHGWNSDATTITFTSDALAEIPAGDYMLSVDYKQRYSWNNTQNNNTKVNIALVNGENTIGSATSPAAEGVQGGNADATYFNDTEWSTLTATFTLAEAVPAGAKVVITLDARGQRRSDFFLDNVQFVKVPGVELALVDLKKAIEVAEATVPTYPVGDGLFQYAEAEITPLTEAIATAQAAYEAAESKEAVEAATETLNAFVADFAPKATTPDPEKQYTFKLKLDDETSLYMNLTKDGIKIEEEPTLLSFVETETAGQYNLVAEGELYVGLAGGNAWTMSTAAEQKAAWTFTALGNNQYYINNLVTAGRFVGTNTNDKTAGTSCYADKQPSNGNVVWIIEEAATPVPAIPIALNAPTFNAEEGTQDEPTMLATDETLKITYTADNLEVNGLTADDVQVKVKVLVTGDLPENMMVMGSTTAHRVMGETFYIPLGETDFPVALKEGYVYQNIAVMAAELVKPATEEVAEETLAVYTGAPVQLHWVGITAPEPEPELAWTDLTDDMFHVWTGIDANAEITAEVPGFENNIGKEVDGGTTIYGNGSVLATQYAALADYQVIKVTRSNETGGMPRLLFGRSEDQSSDFIEIADAQSPYIKAIEDDGLTWIIDLDKIKAEKDGLANLNVVKITWGGSGAITSIQLGKIAQAYEIAVEDYEPERGSIAIDNTKVTEGKEVIITVTSKYELSEISVRYIDENGGEQSIEPTQVGEPVPSEGGEAGVYVTTYTFTMPAADAHIVATFSDTAVAIAGFNADKAKANGKYLENGKVVIYRNGLKYNVAGQAIK